MVRLEGQGTSLRISIMWMESHKVKEEEKRVMSGRHDAQDRRLRRWVVDGRYEGGEKGKKYGRHERQGTWVGRNSARDTRTVCEATGGGRCIW